jgi:hypothetical protein
MSNSQLIRHYGVSMTPRDALIVALSAAVSVEHANAIMDALDEYLAEDPADRVPARMVLRPNYEHKLQAARAERDAALARAEKAEQALRKKATRKKSKESTR